MVKINALFDEIYPELSPNCRQEILKQIIPMDLKKRHRLIKPGEQCTHLCFVEKGLLRCSHIRDNREVNLWFMEEGKVIASALSYFKKVPTDETIYAMEDSRLYAISREALDRIYNRYPEFNFIGRVLTEKYYIFSMEREILKQLKHPADRYIQFQLLYPGLEQRIPAKHIASYLGMATETLSRIKNKK